MANQMYNRFGGKQKGMNNIVDNIKNFQKQLQGNPEEQLNSVINSGKVPQNVLNQAQQMAKPIYQMMKNLV